MNKRIGRILIAAATFALAIAFFALLNTGMAGASAANAKTNSMVNQPACSVEYTQALNHVVFTTTWSGSYPEGEHPFDFGDSLSRTLTGTEGLASFSHDYAYSPTAVITRRVRLDVSDAAHVTASCQKNIVIDDRPVQPPPTQPTCEMTIAHPQLNKFTYTVTWSNGSSAGEYPFSFGDKTDAEVLTGTQNTKSFSHDYAYAPGELTVYTVGVTITNQSLVSACLSEISIDDRVVQPPPTQPACAISMTQAFNRLVFTPTWSGGSESGEYAFQFGDGNSDVLTGTTGSKVLPHDYSYRPGEIITLTSGFTITNGPLNAVCIRNFVIDDRPVQPPTSTLTQTVFLPITYSNWPQEEPTVKIERVSGSVYNHVVLHLTWANSQQNWQTVNWGDGSSVDVEGINGEKNVDHFYSDGEYTIVFTVKGSFGLITTEIPISIHHA